MIDSFEEKAIFYVTVVHIAQQIFLFCFINIIKALCDDFFKIINADRQHLFSSSSFPPGFEEYSPIIAIVLYSIQTRKHNHPKTH